MKVCHQSSRRHWLIGWIISFLFLTAGCSRSKSPTLEVWTISLRPLFTNYMNDSIRQFEKIHPEIRVEWEDLPLDVIQQKLIGALASGHPPSLVNLNTDISLQLAEMGALQNLDSKIPAKIQAGYFPGFWNVVQLQGEHFSIPWYVTTEILIYNAEIFRKAGLNPDIPPKTWEELIQDAIQIKQKTGLYGWFPAVKFIPELQENGIPVVGKNGALLNSPESVALLDRYVRLFREGIIPRDTLALSKAYSEAVDWYQAGKLGILQTGPQFLNRVQVNAPSVYQKTRVAPIPMGAGNVISAAMMNFVIPKNAPLPKEAASFALFLTNAENQLNFSRMVLVFPSQIQAAEDPFFQSSGPDPLLAKARKIGAQELKDAKDLTLPLPHPRERNEAVQDALENALLGRKTPEQALRQANEIWNQLLR